MNKKTKQNTGCNKFTYHHFSCLSSWRLVGASFHGLWDNEQTPQSPTVHPGLCPPLSQFSVITETRKKKKQRWKDLGCCHYTWLCYHRVNMQEAHSTTPVHFEGYEHLLLLLGNLYYLLHKRHELTTCENKKKNNSVNTLWLSGDAWVRLKGEAKVNM